MKQNCHLNRNRASNLKDKTQPPTNTLPNKKMAETAFKAGLNENHTNLLTCCKNKKAQDVDLLFVAIIGLVIAIIIVTLYVALKQFNDNFQNLDTSLISQEAKDITQKVQNKYVGIWDVLFLLLFVFMFVTMVASAFFLDTHPIFFIISLFVTVITALVGGYLANTYATFSENSTINPSASEFKIIPYIFQHYVAILVIIGLTTTIALFAKLRNAGG